MATVAHAQTWKWTGETPAAGDFYIYSAVNNVFIKKTSAVDSDPANATLFTLSAATNCTIEYQDNGTKYVYEGAGNQSWGTTNTNKWTIAKQSNGSYYISHTDPNRSGRTRYIQVSSTAINYPYQNFTGSNRELIFISQAQMEAYNRYLAFVANKASASYANPVDATFLINPGFEGGLSGWTNNGTAPMGIQTNTEAIKIGSQYAEKWEKAGTADFYQTLKGMPAGKYRISVRGVDKAPTKAIFYANNQEVSFENDIKRLYIDLNLSEAQDIKIGVKHSGHPEKTWLGVDEFVVTYYGNDDYTGATEDNPKDVTGWIFNNSFERGTNDGWTHLGVGGAMTIQANSDFGKDGTYYLESWQPGYNKGVEQILENIPAGVYKLTLTAKARGVKNAKLYIGDNETAIDVADAVKEYTVEGTCFEGSVKIGFYSEVADGAPVNGSWMAIDNFRLSFYEASEGSDEVKDGVHYYFGAFTTAPTIELTDEVPNADLSGANITGTVQVTATNLNGLVYAKAGQTFSATNNVVVDGTCDNLVLTDGGTFKAYKNFEATTATYTMGSVATTSAGKTFGTLMIPFAPTTQPADNTVYALTEAVAFGEEIRATETSIAANSPVLVTKAGDYTANNVQVAATNDTYENGQLVGTYKAMEAPASSYVLQKHDNRVAFFMVNDVQPTVKPFRAYIKEQSASVKALSVIFDDEETAISNLTTSLKGEEAIYDLSGRRVNKAQKGIYIVNGKKVLK